MTAQIRTFIEDKNTSSSFDEARGAHNWSAAQILSPLLFVVDICVEVVGQFETKRWVTTSVHEIAQILKSHKTFVWAQVFLAMRTPGNVPGKLLFEELSEVYQTGRVDSYIYRLINGKAFMPDSPHTAEDDSSPSSLTLVYSMQEKNTGQNSIFEVGNDSRNSSRFST
jgi:hypothetical protein